MATGSEDKTIIIWDVKSGNIIKRIEGSNDSITSVVFSHDS